MAKHCYLVTTCALLMTLWSSANAQGPTWSSPNQAPAPRSAAGLVFDEGRGRAVMFGGRDGATVFGDTWEWDGLTWIQRTPATSPSPRSDMAMAYDPVKGVTLLFGGNFGALQDTWRWDGTDWHQVASPITPSASASPGMTYHAGANPGLLLVSGNTYRLSGSTWIQVATSAPSGSLAFVSSTQMTFAQSGSMNSMWSWDGTAWTLNSSLSAVFGASMTYDPDRGSLIAVGGSGGGLFPTFNLHTVVGTPVAAVPGFVAWGQAGMFPLPGFNSSFLGVATCYDTVRRAVLAFGGSVTSLFPPGTATTNKLFIGPSSAPTGQWTLFVTNPTGLGARALTDMAYHSGAGAGSGRAFLFGGWDGPSIRNDIVSFDGYSWTNHGNSALTPRIQPAMCSLPTWGLVMFGGSDFGSTFFNDTSVWNGTDFAPVTPWGQVPSGRREHDMVYFAATQVVIMYGGFNGNMLAETWALNRRDLASLGSFLDWRPISSSSAPGPRAGQKMAYDARRQRVVMFGGWSQPGVLAPATTWELSYWIGGPLQTVHYAWTEITTPTAPPRRFAHGMDYDPARGVVVMTCGHGECGPGCSTQLNDIWEYDGVDWVERQPLTSKPSPREGHSFCYHPGIRRFVMQGGYNGMNYPDETWFYHAPLDSFGEGTAAMKLRCLRFPVAGQVTRFEFDSPLGFAWMNVFPEPSPAPALTLGPGLLCSTGSIYGLGGVLVDAMGPTAGLSFPLPAALAGQGLVLQGVALDTGLCLQLTEPMAVTVHSL